MTNPKKTTLGWTPTAGYPQAQPGAGYGHAQPGPHVPSPYAQTALAQPAYGQPAQPVYGQPVQPAYGQPVHQPAYGQPVQAAQPGHAHAQQPLPGPRRLARPSPPPPPPSYGQAQPQQYGQAQPQPQPQPQPYAQAQQPPARPSPPPSYGQAQHQPYAPAQMPPSRPSPPPTPQPNYAQAPQPPARPSPPPTPQPNYAQAQQPLARPTPQPNYAQAPQPPARPSPQPNYAQAPQPPHAQPQHSPPEYRHSPSAAPAFTQQPQQQQYAQANAGYQQAQAYAQYPASQPQTSQQAYPQQGNPQQAYQHQQAAYQQQQQQQQQQAAYQQQQAAYQQQAYQQGQQPQPQQAYQQGQQPQPHQSQGDWNQRALAAMQSLRRRREQSGERAIPHANATMGASDRVRFVRLTYLHLLGAILVFAGLLYLLMTNKTLYMNVSIPFINFARGGRWNWAIVLGVFMVVSWVADYWASHARSRGMQYAGLGMYVLAEALIFVPLLSIVAEKTASILARGGGHPNILRDSGLVTLAIFGALTASVFISKKDFSFLRSGLLMASSAALVMIGLSLAFGFNLGLVFSVAMVVLAAGYILYQTSQILAHYNPEQYVAASLALFSSVALMFWYVIRIFMRARD